MHTILTKGYSWQPDTRHSKHLCLQGTFLLLIFHSNTWKKYLIYLSMLIHPLYGSIKNIRALSIHQYLSSCDHVILLYSVVISSVAFVSFFPFSGTRLPFCYPLCPMIICYPGDMPWPPPFNRPIHKCMQIYGCFFLGVLETSYSANLFIMNTFQNLESNLHTLVVAMSGKHPASFQVVRDNHC